MKFHFIDVHRARVPHRTLVSRARRLAQRLLRLARTAAPAGASATTPCSFTSATASSQPADLRVAAHSPRLSGAGISCGRHRVARLMRREGIVARTERHFRWTATKRNGAARARPIACSAASPRGAQSRWVSDITYPHRPGLALPRHRARPLLPPHRRLGHGTDPRPAARARGPRHGLRRARPAARAALPLRPGRRVPRGRVQQHLDRHGIIASMSRPGICLDNAVAESFFHTLKTELFYHHHYRTRDQARARDLRLHRSLLQPHPPALDQRLSLARASMKSVYAVSPLTPCPLFRGKFSQLHARVRRHERLQGATQTAPILQTSRRG